MNDDVVFNYAHLPKRKFVLKGWGGTSYDGNDKVGEIFVYHNSKNACPEELFDVQTVKLLFVEKNKQLSTHFHIDKEEIFYIVKGSFEITLIKDGIKASKIFIQHDLLKIDPGLVHSMCGLEDENILLEVSTLDKPDDSYRIAKGD